jgi:hypothetical protein
MNNLARGHGLEEGWPGQPFAITAGAVGDRGNSRIQESGDLPPVIVPLQKEVPFERHDAPKLLAFGAIRAWSFV